MRHTDIGKDADVRTGDLRKAGHFPEPADPHLEHRDLMLFPEIEYGQGKPDLIIKVSLCFQDIVFLAEHGCDHLFCACLSDAAGDPDYLDIQRAAVVFRDVL